MTGDKNVREVQQRGDPKGRPFVATGNRLTASFSREEWEIYISSLRLLIMNDS